MCTQVLDIPSPDGFFFALDLTFDLKKIRRVNGYLDIPHTFSWILAFLLALPPSFPPKKFRISILFDCIDKRVRG